MAISIKLRQLTSRPIAAVTIAFAVLLGAFAMAAPASAVPLGHPAGAFFEPCPAQSDASACDSDKDTIPDTVERVVSGTATGTTGREDRDRDGVSDWVEVMACGTTTCASPTKDSVGDGIPDFARQIVCGSTTCYTGNGDVNTNSVPKWASVVVCGNAGCATRHEDYDSDGISDAVELAACVTPRDALAHTGSTIAIWAIALSAAGLIGTGLVLYRRRALFQAAIDTNTAL